MARRNIYSFSPAERAQLADLIERFANEEMVNMHRNMRGVHMGDPLLFLVFHRAYVGRLERFLRNEGFPRFVPLPEWNPAQCIPEEFDRGGIRNRCPNVSFAAAFSRENLRRFRPTREFGRALELRHNIVHRRVGGTMANVPRSPSAPIFWLWHAFIDDIWLDYQQVPRNRSTQTGGSNGQNVNTRDSSTGRPRRRRRRTRGGGLSVFMQNRRPRRRS